MKIPNCCPDCNNSNKMTFHFHYAPHLFRKNKWDRKHGQFICLGCGYESPIFPIEILDEPVNRLVPVDDGIPCPPAKTLKESQKFNFVVEVCSSEIGDFLNHLKQGGYSSVAAQL